MNSSDYPTLFRESDSLAIDSERNYFRLVKSKTLLMVSTAVIATVASFAAGSDANIRSLTALGTAIFLVATLVVNVIVDSRKPDHIWFGSRAIAESTKTEAWRYMMKMEPYDNHLSESSAEPNFIRRLREILERQPSFGSDLAAYLQCGSQITEKMRQIRNSDFQTRKATYIRDRIQDQRTWYSQRAKWNKRKESHWLILTWMLQFAAVSAAIIIVGLAGSWLNPVGLLTTIATGALSWSQARKYRELSESYALVCEQLGLLEDLAGRVPTEDGLTEIIADAERTISQEHSIWLARRF